MNEDLCAALPKQQCTNCSLNSSLMCRYETRDTTHFFMIFLPLLVTSIGGVIASGLGWCLFGWLGYMLLFFFVWEARVLCSHCPYWAEEGRVLKCHANYGVIKIWKYRPGPMSRSEQVQFIVGALLVVLIPFALLIIGREYLLAVIALSSGVSFGYLLWKNICNRCVNFSCPLNNVPKEIKNQFLNQNPVMKQAWEETRFIIDSRIKGDQNVSLD
jgi:hypothetical protein